MGSNECRLTNQSFSRTELFLFLLKCKYECSVNGNVLLECLELMLLTLGFLTFFFKTYKTNILGESMKELFLFQSAFFVLLMHSDMKT